MADARGALARSEKDVAQHHLEMRRLVESLRTSTEMAELTDTLGKLTELLALHFLKEEEPDGFLESLTACMPEKTVEIAALQREHEEMKQALNRLCRTIAQPGMNHVAVHAATEGLLQMLGNHERHEHDLAESVLRDNGARA